MTFSSWLHLTRAVDSAKRLAHHRAPMASDELLRGRACYERREWNDAFEALSLADRSMPLEVEDLHRLAWSAGLAAHDEAMLATQERVYHARLNAGEDLPAARAAFWLGFRLLARGEPARASGWLGRAQRLVEQHAEDCVGAGLSTAAGRAAPPERGRARRGAGLRQARDRDRRGSSASPICVRSGAICWGVYCSARVRSNVGSRSSTKRWLPRRAAN